ncbi:PAS domain S-box-containing protein [Lysobacter niabensis]|uniref:histidine kinase n=1 Tax=Agrilutibacter niabensis TaxID=380628 RepID=A0ABU1VM31_9GAMM|nr:PAS domain-containing protein [Lysobacter niabensis]MDR7098385.1 PAS domain S-box-containing protein [Lysobacter niabensis]
MLQDVLLLATVSDIVGMLDFLPTMAWTALPDGRIDFVNRRWIDYTGLAFCAPGAWGTQTAVDSADIPKIRERWRSILASGAPGEMEARLRRADGRLRRFRIDASPVRDDTSHITMWCGVANEIKGPRVTDRPDENPDRRSAVGNSAARERNLVEFINSIPAMAWSAGPDGSPEFFNRHYLDYVGRPFEAMTGRGWQDSVHPDDQAELAATWKGMRESEQAGEAEARLRRHDGHYRWFLFRASPLRDDCGRIVKWCGINTDIDDRKNAEAELRRSEAFLAEGQHLARMGNFSWRVATGEIAWSEPLYRIFGFEPGTPITVENSTTRVHPDDIQLLERLIEAARSGATSFEYQHRLLMPDRSIKHVHVIAHRADYSGQIEYIGAVLDITQRRLAEAALNEARSELAHVARILSLGALTASIAHEINQPLSGIVTNAGTCLRMLASDPPNVSGARESAQRIIRDGNRAAEVVAGLRSLFSRSPPMIEAIDLNAAAAEVIAMLKDDLDKMLVSVRTDFDNSASRVGGDRVQLQQVVMNLLRNGAEAMSDVHDRPRLLTVTTECDGDATVRLTVRDVGTGLDREVSERLFDAFYTTKREGMGVGLAVSRSIVDSHGGRIWAQRNDDCGASFAFTIPIYVEGARLTAPL